MKRDRRKGKKRNAYRLFTFLEVNMMTFYVAQK